MEEAPIENDPRKESNISKNRLLANAPIYTVVPTRTPGRIKTAWGSAKNTESKKKVHTYNKRALTYLCGKSERAANKDSVYVEKGVKSIGLCYRPSVSVSRRTFSS